MLIREYSDAGRVRRVTVTKRGTGGWDVREERDTQLLRETTYTDWHRVERALRVFELPTKTGTHPN